MNTDETLPQITIHLTLKLDQEYLADWMDAWASEIRDKLREIAGIDDARMEFTEGMREIVLAR